MSEWWTITTADLDPSTLGVTLRGHLPGITPRLVSWPWEATVVEVGLDP